MTRLNKKNTGLLSVPAKIQQKKSLQSEKQSMKAGFLLLFMQIIIIGLDQRGHCLAGTVLSCHV